MCALFMCVRIWVLGAHARACVVVVVGVLVAGGWGAIRCATTGACGVLCDAVPIERCYCTDDPHDVQLCPS